MRDEGGITDIDTIEVAKKITLTATGQGGQRGLREFRSELVNLLDKGATIEAIEKGSGLFRVHLKQYDEWELGELMGDAAKAVGA
jgi:hypothetical protein